MKRFNCLVSLGTHMGVNPHHEIPKQKISKAEVILLRTIHGKESVFNIVPVEGEFTLPRVTNDGKTVNVEVTDMEVYRHLSTEYTGIYNGLTGTQLIEKTFGVQLEDMGADLDDLENDLPGERLTAAAPGRVDDDPGLQPPAPIPQTTRTPIS